jgi:TP901 family phage tail tape measure protein
MSDNLIDAVELKVQSPKVALPGLDDAHNKLRAIGAALDYVNGRLAGMNSGSVFQRTRAQLADLLKPLGTGTRKIIPVQNIAAHLGIPDQKDFDAFISNWKSRNKGKLRSMFASETMGGIGGATTRVAGFASADKAAAVVQSYFKAAEKRAAGAQDALRNLFGGGGGNAPGGPLSAGSPSGGPIPLLVPASQIVATLGPGAITLMIPPGQVTAGGGYGGSSGGGGGGGSHSGGGSGGGNFSGGSGTLLEEKTTITKKQKLVQQKQLESAGETIDSFYKEVDGQLAQIKEIQTSSPLKKAKEKLENQIAGVKSDLAGNSGPQGLRKAADMLRSFVGTSEAPTRAAKELESLGQGKLVSKARADAAKLEAQGIKQSQAQLVQDAQQTFTLRKELDAAKRRGDQEEAKRIRQERAQLERRIRENNAFLQAGQKSDDQNAKRRAAVNDLTRKQSQASAYRSATYQGADAAWQDFLARGGRMTSERQSLRQGGPRRLSGELESGGMKETLTVTYGKAGAEVERLTKTLSEARKEGGYLAGDFVKNTAKVTLWAASVGVLYKSLELATHSMSQLVELGPQVGRLEQIFKGVGGTAHQLAVDTLGQAASYGASTREAMEAAIQWSRLGLTRVQVNEAVRVSLMAANVAQIDALDATEKLQGVMQAYKLDVGELRGELGQIVAITNTYNVTTADMLTGLSRVAAVAKQAGLPLAELQGLLGATIGGTAQSGANIGNMAKSVILALSNPDLQQKLRSQFRFEPTTGGEEIKGMSQLLSDLFVKYNHLNQLQKQSLLFSVGGRTQSSRLEAMLDGYIKAQILAVNAQLHLNTAEQENAKITATLKTQVHGLVAEWERFVFIQGNHGPVQAMTSMSTALRNVLSLLNTPIGGAATTGIMGLLAAGGVKSILTGMSMRSGDGFMSRSGAHIRSALGEFNNSMTAVYATALGGGVGTNVATRQTGVVGATQTSGMTARLYVMSEAMLRVGRSSAVSSAAVRGMATAFGAATRALGVGLIALRQWIVPLAVISIAVSAFNRSMEAIGLSSERAERKLAGFNEEAQKAEAAASAYAEAAQALETIERAIQPEKGFQAMRSEDQRKYIQQSAELVGLYEPDLTKQEALQRAYRAQTEALRQQGDIMGVINLMEAERNKLGAHRQEELQKQFVSIVHQQRTLDAEIKRLNDRQHSPILGQFGRDSRQQAIDQKERQRSELGSAKTKNILDQTATSYEDRLKYDEKYQSALRTEKLLWESIAQVYSSVNTNNPFERNRLNIASLEAQNRAIQSHIKLLDEEDQADVAGQAAKEGRMKELRARETQVRTDMMAIRQPGNALKASLKYLATGQGLTSEELSKKQTDLDLIEQQKNALGRNEFPGPEGIGFARRQSLRSVDTEELKANRAEIEAQNRNRPIVDFQTQMQFGREEARRETIPSGVGRDETQKLQNRKKAIDDLLLRMQMMPQTAELLSRELDLQTQKYEDQVALRNRSMTVERDIKQLTIDQRKEMEHSLLGSGPAEMLRKMAALKMGSDGRMGIGQFLSLSPEMRRDVAMVDTRFDPRMIDLQRERRRQRQGSPEDFDKSQLAISGQIAGLADKLKEAIPERAAYDAAKASIDQLATSAGGAASKLDALSVGLETMGKVIAVLIGTSGGGPGGAPRNPQAGGVGAGAGFTPGGGGVFRGVGAGTDF